jgi:hypothetical protein
MSKQAAFSSIFAAIAIIAAPSLVQMPETQALAQTKKFFCDTSGQFPATMARSNNSNVRLISWRSTVGDYDPATRCRQVSERFQSFHQQGRLRYITSGRSRETNSNIICVADRKDGPCATDGLLFTLRPGRSPSETLREMFRLNLAVGSDGLRETTERIYVDPEACLKIWEKDANQTCAPANQP